LLKPFFCYLYSGDVSNGDLTYEDCAFIMSNGGEYDVLNSAGVANPGFGKIVALARAQTSEPLTPSNCISLLQARLNPGFEAEKEEALRYIEENFRSLQGMAANRSILDKLPPDTIKDILYAIMHLRTYHEIELV
jgi:hypothetical protein